MRDFHVDPGLVHAMSTFGPDRTGGLFTGSARGATSYATVSLEFERRRSESRTAVVIDNQDPHRERWCRLNLNVS